MNVHPAAALLPPMTLDEFAALKADIAEHGQREPILLSAADEILDGWHRFKACSELGILPKTQRWDGTGSPTALVLSLNVQRRHLSASQKAAVGADALPMFEAEAKERQRQAGKEYGRGQAAEKVRANLPEPISPEPEHRARDDAAKATGASPRAVQAAAAIKDKAPDLHEKVKAGEMTVNAATKEVEARQVAAVMEVAGDPEGRIARAALKLRYGKAIGGLSKVITEIDPEEYAGTIDSGETTSARWLIRDMRAWLDRLEAALSGGLRVVGGTD